MSARAVREDDENKEGGRGLGLAAAAAVVGVGLGVGAALYYFLKPQDRPEPAGPAATHGQPHTSNADRAPTFRCEDVPSLSWDYNNGVQQDFSSMLTPQYDSDASDDEWQMSRDFIGSLFSPSHQTTESNVMDDPEDMDSINQEIFRQRAWTLEQCSICFEAMLRGDSELWMLRCGHQFHIKCVQPWTRQHNNCPNCREAI